jgi:hypothetical protein
MKTLVVAIIGLVLHFSVCQWRFIQVQEAPSLLGGFLAVANVANLQRQSLWNINLGGTLIFVLPRENVSKEIAVGVGVVLPAFLSIISLFIGGGQGEEATSVQRETANGETTSSNKGKCRTSEAVVHQLYKSRLRPLCVIRDIVTVFILSYGATMVAILGHGNNLNYSAADLAQFRVFSFVGAGLGYLIASCLAGKNSTAIRWIHMVFVLVGVFIPGLVTQLMDPGSVSQADNIRAVAYQFGAWFVAVLLSFLLRPGPGT